MAIPMDFDLLNPDGLPYPESIALDGRLKE